MQRIVHGARSVASDGHWSLQASANLMEAWLLFWQGKIAQLEGAFQVLEDDSRWLGQPTGSRIRLLTLKVNYQIVCDDKEAVRQTRDAIAEHASSLDPTSDLRLASLAIAVRVSAAIGDWPAVRMLLPALDAGIGREIPNMQMFIRSFKALLALRDGRMGEALTTLRELAEICAAFDTMFLEAMVRTRLALAELANGSPTAAWQALEPVIERAIASGNVGQILATGVQSLTELSLASWGASATQEGLAALRQWIETTRRLKAGSHDRPRASTADHAGLSERELQVLALLAEGQSNKLIARALDLSPHTVKRHVARILDRLDLASRMQAAGWYHARFGS